MERRLNLDHNKRKYFLIYICVCKITDTLTTFVYVHELLFLENIHTYVCIWIIVHIHVQQCSFKSRE